MDEQNTKLEQQRKQEEKRLKYNAYMREWHRKKRGTKSGAKPGRPANTSDVLWSKVDKREPDQCWPWKGFLSERGYGRTWINDKAFYAHRVIFALANPGLIELEAPKDKSEGKFVLHRCDNPVCCNPAHLFLGTHLDNMRDKVLKHRSPDYSGDKGPRCKLTMDQARQARALRQEGAKIKTLAEMFGISEPSMKSLIAGKSYREPVTVNA